MGQIVVPPLIRNLQEIFPLSSANFNFCGNVLVITEGGVSDYREVRKGACSLCVVPRTSAQFAICESVQARANRSA